MDEQNEGLEREMTFGERAVGLSFNPGGNPQVDEIKKTYASAIDQINNAYVNEQDDFFTKILFDNAIIQAVNAQMAAVKLLTWNHKK